ncbi:MAG: hypothetical protein ChlgKO_01230 [Chlamydiales bacterium]
MGRSCDWKLVGKVFDKLQKEIKRFDLGALLLLLEHLGFSSQDVLFESNPDLSSRSGVCEKISFQEIYPKVRVLLNRGLLSSQSALPSYFRKKMDEGEIDEALFSRFLGFFDHHLALQSLEARLLDRGGAHFDWNEMLKNYLHLLILNSISTICFLFQVCFPELVVKVKKVPKIVKVEGSSLVLGKARLGPECCLGQSLFKVVPSYEVLLFSSNSHTDQDVPWPKEARRRLFSSVFSYFKGTNLLLSVRMVLEDCENPARLKREPILGYGTLGRNCDPLIIHLFSGEI